MRTIIYAILDENTGKKTIVGANNIDANKKLAEMQTANPSGSYRVIYKYFSF